MTEFFAIQKKGEDASYDDKKTQDAVRRNFQTLGQAAGQLSAAERAAHPEIEWRDMIGFRNVIVHDYLGLDLQTVWSIIVNEPPTLRDKIAKITNR